MEVCPHCDVEMEPKRDSKTGEIFCTNCLDTLHNLRQKAKTDNTHYIKEGAQNHE